MFLNSFENQFRKNYMYNPKKSDLVQFSIKLSSNAEYLNIKEVLKHCPYDKNNPDFIKRYNRIMVGDC